ncbi:MAG: hypothetical protein CFE24_09065 [Flavobacterium sp. BFFFF2]|nr:MAG: hypothetical protein CFE24_09065 [Flavobacterium sp. BFFFF2]
MHRFLFSTALFLLFQLPSWSQTNSDELTLPTPLLKNTISGQFDASDPSHTGIHFERFAKTQKIKDLYRSHVFEVSSLHMLYKAPGISVRGRGFELGIGTRNYWQKKKPFGIYTENFLTYGNVSVRNADKNFNGTYSYVSLINTNLGYKFLFKNGLSVDPYVGFNWKWTFKGQGDVDNINVDHFVFKAGIKIGYSFQ